MKVTVSTRGRSTPAPIPSQQKVKSIVETVLRSGGVRNPGDVNVVFVDDRTIRRLHRTFLNDPASTDVIAFPYGHDAVFNGKETMFGDIYISLPQARLNAKEYNQPIRTELTRLIIHGLLHLLGYTDHKPAPKKKMWAKQEALVKRLG